MVWGDEVHVEGARKGVLVSDAHVHFENSSFVNCSHTCCEVMSLYSAEFINCQFTRARYAGLSFMEQRTIEGEHTQHIVRSCLCEGNEHSGLSVRGPVLVVAESCRSESNREGFVSFGWGDLRLIDCLSSRDQLGCTSRASHVRATDTVIRDTGPNGCALYICLLYTSPSPRDATLSRMPSSA